MNYLIFWRVPVRRQSGGAVCLGLSEAESRSNVAFHLDVTGSLPWHLWLPWQK